MRNTLNVSYLVTGLVFIGLSAAWLLSETGVIDPGGFQWFLPAVLLAAGLIGLAASLGKGVVGRQSRPEPTYADDTPYIPDLTSDLDRKLADHEATTTIDTEGTSS